MEIVDKVRNFMQNEEYRFTVLSAYNFYNSMPDEEYLKKLYRVRMGKELDLYNPQTYTEKLQWLKLHDRKPVYTQMVDKYEAKKFVADRIGSEHIIPTYGVWNSFDEINFENLPDQFVLKVTHDSGGMIVCKNKKAFDKKSARKFLKKKLKTTEFKSSREWPYKDVKPRIIAEQYIDSLGEKESIEYKTTCFDGKVGFVTICTGIAHSDFDKRTNDHFDVNFNHMPWYVNYKNAKTMPQKPAEWEELIQICEKLSVGCPVLRVDCYIVDGKILFGELTFYTWGGYAL